MRKFEALIEMANREIAIQQENLKQIEHEIQLKTRGLMKRKIECEEKVKALTVQASELIELGDIEEEQESNSKNI